VRSPGPPGGCFDVEAGGGFDPWPAAAVHVEWFAAGARQAARRGDVVVAADVLSLSTTLTIAAERDFTSLVYAPAEIALMGGIEAAAAALSARPMSRLRLVAPGGLSLSPASLLGAAPGQRVLFSSLNGAAVIAAAHASPYLVVGSLRNADAAAQAAAAALEAGVAARVTVIACGEHWPSVTGDEAGLRPAIEDWVGAGVISGRLAARGYRLSAEAAAAAAAAAADVRLLRDCVSARELRAAGFASDVELALELDASSAVPVRTEAAGQHELRPRRAG
jgi:2-phosphosulfolactate phosphatase